jgi:hypothetical protein
VPELEGEISNNIKTLVVKPLQRETLVKVKLISQVTTFQIQTNSTQLLIIQTLLAKCIAN